MPDGSKDTCLYDSGGPLVTKASEDDGYSLIGIVSFGDGCGPPNKYGVSTEFSNYIEWVAETACTGEDEDKCANKEQGARSDSLVVKRNRNYKGKRKNGKGNKRKNRQNIGKNNKRKKFRQNRSFKSESEEFYCQTTTRDYCNIEVDQGKLFCPSRCSDNDYKDMGFEDESRELIVDLTTFDEVALQHSRLKRQAFDNPAVGAFAITLLFELSRMFVDSSIR